MRAYILCVHFYVRYVKCKQSEPAGRRHTHQTDRDQSACFGCCHTNSRSRLPASLTECTCMRAHCNCNCNCNCLQHTNCCCTYGMRGLDRLDGVHGGLYGLQHIVTLVSGRSLPRAVRQAASLLTHQSGGIIRIDLSTQDGNALVEVGRVRCGWAAIASLRLASFACIASTRLLPVSSHSIPLTRSGPPPRHTAYSAVPPPPSRSPSLCSPGRAEWVTSPAFVPSLPGLLQAVPLPRPTKQSSVSRARQRPLVQPASARFSLLLCLLHRLLGLATVEHARPPDAPGAPARYPVAAASAASPITSPGRPWFLLLFRV